MTRTKLHAPLLPMAACLMAGIAVGDYMTFWPTALLVLLPCLVVTAFLYRWPRLQTLGIACCVLLTGAILGSRCRQQLHKSWDERPTVTEVVIVSEPVIKEKVVVADLMTLQGQWKLKGRFFRNEDSERLRLGDCLVVRSRIQGVHAWHNGNFDYQRYMASHGFVGETYVIRGGWQRQQLSLSTLSVLQRSRLRFLLWRHALLEHYRQWSVTDEAYGILAAMTLGEKTQLDASLKETYSQVGASHILALSGLHLMIIFTIISLFASWPRRRILSQVLIVLAIWVYAFLVGLPPSVVRAATMITVYALLSIGYRERMSVNTLAFVAIVMLIVHPYTLYDVGFQLSFAAVLAILLFTPLFDQFVAPHLLQRHWWLKFFWGMTTVSLSAQLGTAPLVAYYFGRFPTYFLLSNYVVIPLATLILYMALCSVATWWWTALQGVLVAILSAIVVTMNRLLQLIAMLPYCSIDNIRVSALQVFLIYIVIACGYVLFKRQVASRWCCR